MKNKKSYKQFIEDHTIDIDASRRGGVIKIDVSELFPEIVEAGDDAVMGASQNYLGGGMCGATTGGAMFQPDDLENDKQREIFFEIKDQIKRYFHAITNEQVEDWDEWSSVSYDQNQSMAVSGY